MLAAYSDNSVLFMCDSVVFIHFDGIDIKYDLKSNPIAQLLNLNYDFIN